MMKNSPAVLVIDLGLTNCKALVFSLDGQIMGQATGAYETLYPESGLAEQDPNEWLDASRDAIGRVLNEQPALAGQIEVISVTGHMHALVGVDRSGHALGNAIILGDQRSVESARWITAEMGLETIYRITGARMEESMPAAKIHWLKENAPELFKSAHYFTGCKDFIRGWLTGDRLTDPIDACAMSLYDLKQAAWSEELLALIGITTDQLPDIAHSTQIAGGLLPTVAPQLGLPEGIPVVVGGGDDIEVLGAGLMTPGNSKEHLGTTGSFLTCAKKLVYDPDMALEVYPHAEPGLWVIGGSITSAGAALAWAADVLGYGDVASAFRSGVSFSIDIHTNPLIFVPHLSGERCPSWNPAVRGVWAGLSITHDRTDLMRAAFQGTAHALGSILKRIDMLAGVQSQVVVANRKNDSHDWLQLRANVYGRPLGVLGTHEPTGLGAMILGAVGIGAYSGLSDAVGTVTSVTQHIEPGTGQQNWYSQQSDLYHQVQTAMKPVWTAIQNGASDMVKSEH